MNSQNSNKRSIAIGRRNFVQSGIGLVGCGLLAETFFPDTTLAEEEKPPVADIIGTQMILKGLDGMSRSTAKGKNPFVDGHNAAAVMASAFFCREQHVPDEAQRELLAFMEKGLLRNRIYEARPREEPVADLEGGLLEDLHEGIGDLRRSGHNIIFGVLSLKALRAVPQAKTPERMAGLREMIRSFRTPDRGIFVPDDEELADLEDEKAFIRFVFREYLSALDLYLNGKGHHGFAGHTLTVGHALLELFRMGYKETARKGVKAFWQFVGQARKGANRGGKKVADGPAKAPTALDDDFWAHYRERRPKELVSSHLIKYPYSYYALLRELDDRVLKERLAENLFHLRALT